MGNTFTDLEYKTITDLFKVILNISERKDTQSNVNRLFETLEACE